jgi:hypothetical protein
MKKSLLIQALLAVAYAGTAHAGAARTPTAPSTQVLTKTCSCCKATIPALDVDHVAQCRHLALLKGEPTGEDDDLL